MENYSLFCLNICESVANSQTFCGVTPDITKRMAFFNFDRPKTYLVNIKIDKVTIEYVKTF